MSGLPFFQVDAFASAPLTGNPAAVMPLDKWLPDEVRVEPYDPESPEFRRLVELSIGIKARVVGEDFTEQGLREILNYGHTLGHAIEHTVDKRGRIL